MTENFGGIVGCHFWKKSIPDFHLRKEDVYLGVVMLFGSTQCYCPPYHMSVFKLPKWIIARIEKIWRAFLCKGKEEVSGFHYFMS